VKAANLECTSNPILMLELLTNELMEMILNLQRKLKKRTRCSLMTFSSTKPWESLFLPERMC